MKRTSDSILPGTLDASSAAITLFLSIAFSLLGIWISKEYIYLFPAIFGIAIPIANWNKLEKGYRIHKLILSVIASIVLFHVAIFLSSSWFMMYTVAVVNGLILLLIYSFLIEHLDPSPITYITTAILCLLALHFGLNTTKSGPSDPEPIYIFIFWTFSFTAGLVTGLRRTR
ncbi:MAG: hypothetical protein ABJG99_11785 [Crocinitomicaceae bacterium]